MGRIILICIAIFIGAPILIVLGMAAFGSAAAAVYIYYLMDMFGMNDPPQKKGWDVVNLQRGSPKVEGFKAIVDPTKMHDRRIVRVKSILGLEDIKATPRPTNPDDYANFIRVNLPQLAAEECGRLKQVLAAQCVVTEARAQELDRGIYLASFILSFTVKDAFGNVPANVPLQFSEISQNIGDSGPSRLITRGQQQDVRLGMYRKAVSLCQATRTAKGNCAINDLDIQIERDRSGWSTLRIKGIASLAMLERQPK